MFHILGIIFFIIIFVLLVGFTIVYKIVGTIVGMGRTVKSKNKRYSSGATEDYNTSEEKKSATKKKVFDDNEGEYIDFEEIKD